MGVKCRRSTRADPMTLWLAAKVWGREQKSTKRLENTGSVALPQQDLKHPGLSVSRGRPTLGSGYFLQDWSGFYQDKP